MGTRTQWGGNSMASSPSFLERKGVPSQPQQRQELMETDPVFWNISFKVQKLSSPIIKGRNSALQTGLKQKCIVLFFIQQKTLSSRASWKLAYVLERLYRDFDVHKRQSTWEHTAISSDTCPLPSFHTPEEEDIDCRRCNNQGCKKCTSRIIIPIGVHHSCREHNSTVCQTTLMDGTYVQPTLIRTRDHFLIDLTFSMTDYCVQGRTLSIAIIVLEERPEPLTQMGIKIYICINIACLWRQRHPEIHVGSFG